MWTTETLSPTGTLLTPRILWTAEADNSWPSNLSSCIWFYSANQVYCLSWLYPPDWFLFQCPCSHHCKFSCLPCSCLPSAGLPSWGMTPANLPRSVMPWFGLLYTRVPCCRVRMSHLPCFCFLYSDLPCASLPCYSLDYLSLGYFKLQ